MIGMLGTSELPFSRPASSRIRTWNATSCDEWPGISNSLAPKPRSHRVDHHPRFAQAKPAPGPCHASHPRTSRTGKLSLPSGRTPTYDLNVRPAKVFGTGPPRTGRFHLGRISSSPIPAWEAVVYPSANGANQGATAGRVGQNGALSSPIEHDSEHKTSGSVFPAGSTRGATLVYHSVSNREHAFE
jgi:hypothetical protein